MKRLLALLLSVSIFASLLTSCGQENQPNSSQPTLDENQVEIKQDEDSLEQQAIYPLNAIKKLPEIEPYQGVRPYSEHWFDNLYIDADLSDNVSLAYSLTISDKTTFKKMPAGYNADDLIEWGKSPGLNVDILHKYGFTGAGAVIAYVDQPMALHEQYENANFHYTNNSESNNSMHGPAVMSLLVGKDIGTAPDAEVYFYGHSTWKRDQITHAECLYQIIEQNKSLPNDQKITMVGFSDNIDNSEKNSEAFEKAVKACEEAGIMVWFCGEYGAAAFIPMSDRNSYSNVVMADWYHNAGYSLVYIPVSGRTTAATENGAQYYYWASGGLSWAMPYVLGLYAIATEIDPSLTQINLRGLILETACETNGIRVINPVGFIAKVLQGVGRNDEAQAMLDEVAQRNRYMYAIMDTTYMTNDDLKAVDEYLANITDRDVIVVDTAYFGDEKELYTALKNDATQRPGKVAGVQIFGTPGMVPAFNVKYKVMMGNGTVDDGGTLLTDLFYGNFDNDIDIISSGYNVMDHFEQGWDVELSPQWPVARLPLTRGEFSDFFKKYDDFVVITGLKQQRLVNFSNPIFASSNHIDDMGIFLNRMKKEYGIINVPYSLYGNQIGQYPVTTKVKGGFTSENLSAENKAGVMELLINTHGQWNNLDKCYFIDGQEKRESFINKDTINSVLDTNLYYLDCWACLNGQDLSNNITTTALHGNCVGAFTATAIISNNGVNCNASIDDMKNSNFYYFYYNYLKSLHEGKSRSDAFFIAQQKYAESLIANSNLPIPKGEGNYQFNMYNLLAYHNFGVLEPNHASAINCESVSIIPFEHMSKNDVIEVIDDKLNLTEGKPIADPLAMNIYNNLGYKIVEVYSITRQKLNNGYTRFEVEYMTNGEVDISVFDSPNGENYKVSTSSPKGERRRMIFDVPNKVFYRTQKLTINFSFVKVEKIAVINLKENYCEVTE